METQDDRKTKDFETSDNILVHQALSGDYAIYSLPCVPRTVVSLYYNQQMNYVEIGQMLMMPVSSVKARFHRAKPFLHAALQHNRSST